MDPRSESGMIQGNEKAPFLQIATPALAMTFLKGEKKGNPSCVFTIL
jgi:hypothetical protein